jgi:AcrR family transcriptional regulator
MGHREALLEGSITCLQQKGYAATTARDIVKVSGANLGSIGYHYGSKEQLLDQALLEGVKRWFEPLIASAAAASDELAPRLREVIRALLETLPRNRPLVIAYFEALVRAERSETLRAQLATSFHELHLALAENLRLALASDDPDRDTTADVVASLISAILDGLIIRWLIDPSRLCDTDGLAIAAEQALAVLGRPNAYT